MAAAETLKNTVEQFSTASNQAFKDGVEKSLAALAEANTHSKKNLEAVVASVTAATKGAEELGAQMVLRLFERVMHPRCNSARTAIAAACENVVAECTTSSAASAASTHSSRGSACAA